jgi:hypothetical protein
MIVEKIFESERIERFKISAKNKPLNFIILENNRPLIRNKLHLKSRRIDWKVYKGEVGNVRALELTIEAIVNKLEPPT